MTLPWIRIYCELLHDAKFHRFTAVEKWIWVGLLLLAGEAKKRGRLEICEGIGYTQTDLISQLDLDQAEAIYLEPALDKFQLLQMIDVDNDGIIVIKNFDKRQYVYESNMPEAVRQRVAKHRQSHVTNLKRECNDIDTDTDTDTDNNPPIVPPKVQKVKYGEFVTMTESQYTKLVEAYGQRTTKQLIQALDNYKGASGKKYKDDYRAILSWVVKRVLGENTGPATRKVVYTGNAKPLFPDQDYSHEK